MKAFYQSRKKKQPRLNKQLNDIRTVDSLEMVHMPVYDTAYSIFTVALNGKGSEGRAKEN